LLMNRVSVVTPLVPKVLLRFDGLYWTQGRTDFGSQLIECFRFHPDGSVFSVDTIPENNSSKIFSWLQHGGTYTGSDRYVVTGSEIHFSTNGAQRTRVDYGGTVSRKCVSLRSHYYFSGVDKLEELHF